MRHTARLSVRTIPVSAVVITSGRATSHCVGVDFRSVGPDYGRANIAISPSLTTDQGNRASNSRRAPLRDNSLDELLFRPLSLVLPQYPGAGLVCGGYCQIFRIQQPIGVIKVYSTRVTGFPSPRSRPSRERRAVRGKRAEMRIWPGFLGSYGFLEARQHRAHALKFSSSRRRSL
jgi:hypothetical protein